MIAVVCKNQKHFDDWLKPWCDYDNMKKFKCVRKIEDVEGCLFTEMVCIGDYWNTPYIEDLLIIVSSRIR